ncbi:MAG: sulfite exporter TauE/SafE family protein [Cytophagaceae bacterium]
MELTTILLLFCIFVVAILYSSVGHGGASGYLATMAMFAVPVAVMKPSALILNILVSFLSFFAFYRKGHFQLKLFWPFVVGSFPAAFIGAQIPLSDSLYKKILAVCLLIAILRMLWSPSNENDKPVIPFSIPLAIVFGACIGLLSGMIGIGGGIILTPLLLLLRWTNIKTAAALSALFIFCNSISGLAGLVSKGYVPDSFVYSIAVVAFAGGLLGSWLGSTKYSLKTLTYSLAVGLMIASVKLFLT